MSKKLLNIKTENMKERLLKLGSDVFSMVAFVIAPILLFYLMESFEHNALEEVRATPQLLNVILFELIAWFLFFLSGSARIALSIETVIAFLYGLINHYVMAFRSTPFVPWDIFSIKTATSVAGNYDFTPTEDMLITSALFVVLFVLVQFIKLKFPYQILLRVIPTAIISILMVSFVTLLWDGNFQSRSNLYPYLFTPTYMTNVNGMAVTFAMNLAYIHVEKPAGYSAQEAEEILASYENETAQNPEELPNIIVVMSEAFSDLSVLGDFTPSEDYMPFIHGLQAGNENTITGELTVSVCGGNTANSEFEFLTGHTMDFFPMGSIPYQQYIKGEHPSIASQLRDLGYHTVGMHPYGATGWCRDEVYPWLGFEDSYFINDFKNKKYIRSYVSDKTAYGKIIDLYEAKGEDPMFFFEVTMQNHGSYSDLHKNFTPFIKVEGVENNAIEQYLSLIKVSDEETRLLVEYFSQVEENTMIVFFGDHQPNDYVANRILRLNGMSTTTLTEEQVLLRYQVPYFIWANYDIKEATDEDMDISFLGANMLEIAGIKTTAYQNFLLEYQEVLEAAKAGDAEAVKKAESYKKTYQKLQYYFMYDYEASN